MTSNIPSGFVPISALSSHVDSTVNVMGVVTDFLPPTKSRGKDYTSNFRLADRTVYDDGVKMRFFKPMETELPQIQSNGDVLVLRNIKVMPWSGMVVGVSSHQTQWTLFPAAGIPEKVPAGPLKLRQLGSKNASTSSQEHMKYAIELCNSRDRASNGIPQSPANPAMAHIQALASSSPNTSTPGNLRRDKFSLIKDLQINTFYDLIGQVAKIYPGNGIVELYITDYTTNSSLYNYEWGRDDPDNGKKWSGPLGKMTLTVSLFSPHSYFAQSNVQEGQIVFLRNTRIKFSRDGKMEGCLHTDKMNPDRIEISILHDHDDERIKALLRRKREYAKRFHEQSEAYVELARGQKRKQEEEPKLSKTQARKRRKQQREQEKRDRKSKQRQASGDEAEDNKENTDPLDALPLSNSSPRARHKSTLDASTDPPPLHRSSKKLTLNKNIRTTKPDIPTRPLSSILSLSTHALTTPQGTPYTLPFQNIKSRAVVRIVDFYPPNIADFAVKRRPISEYDVLSDFSGDSSSDDDDSALNSSNDNEANNDEDSDDDDQNAINTEYTNRGQTSKWEWRFALTVEDASSPASPQQQRERMTVYVSDQDAVFLIKIDASDLNRRSRALAALRERLFLLWGDLEERMMAREGEGEGGRWKGRGRRARGGDGGGETQVKSMPFECCIKEYGVRKRRGIATGEEGGVEGKEDGGAEEEETWGWERRFGLFGTTIL